MIRSRPAARMVTALMAALVIGACSSGGGSSPSETPRGSPAAAPSPAGLTIYAAASLKRALEKIKEAYAIAAPGTTLTVSTDSSAALETQIEQGAPADVFLSADTANPKKLVDKSLTAGPAIDFAGNTLTIIVPTTNPGGMTSPADLAKPGIKVIGAGDTVPITKYATQLVENLAGLPGYPSGFAAAYAANVASREDNVGAVLAKIEVGEGDAAIVYATDAKPSSKVTTIAVPREANVPATYAGVVLKGSAAGDAAEAFMTWLTGPDGQAILTELGFQAPGD